MTTESMTSEKQVARLFGLQGDVAGTGEQAVDRGAGFPSAVQHRCRSCPSRDGDTSSEADGNASAGAEVTRSAVSLWVTPALLAERAAACTMLGCKTRQLVTLGSICSKCHESLGGRDSRSVSG